MREREKETETERQRAREGECFFLHFKWEGDDTKSCKMETPLAGKHFSVITARRLEAKVKSCLILCQHTGKAHISLLTGV